MIKQLLIALVLVFGLSGCVTMQDGSHSPNYELIEIGSMASMAILVNEIKVDDATVVLTYNRLMAVHNTLTCTGTDCPAFTLVALESMIMGALPIEYQALGVAGIRLIKSRSALYLDPKLPDVENLSTIRKVASSVVMGMVQAMAPKVHQIQGG